MLTEAKGPNTQMVRKEMVQNFSLALCSKNKTAPRVSHFANLQN
jgi:hypothetical protein